MKTFRIVESNEKGEVVYTDFSEKDIFDSYWEYWFSKMVNAKKADFFTLPELVKMCIDDWVACGWLVLLGAALLLLLYFGLQWTAFFWGLILL